MTYSTLETPAEKTTKFTALLVYPASAEPLPEFFEDAISHNSTVSTSTSLEFLPNTNQSKEARSLSSVYRLLETGDYIWGASLQGHMGLRVRFLRSPDIIVRHASQIFAWCTDNFAVLASCWRSLDTAFSGHDSKNEIRRLTRRLLGGVNLIPFWDCNANQAFSTELLRHTGLDGLFVSWIYARKSPTSIAIKMSKGMGSTQSATLEKALSRIAWRRACQHLKDSVGTGSRHITLVPVPSCHRRSPYLVTRLCAELESLGYFVSVAHHGIERNNSTIQLKDLDWFVRRQEAHRLFVRGRLRVDSPIVILVDDVVTSGATMRACCELLRSAGFHSVYGVAICACPEDAPLLDVYNRAP